jgi:hypothetical protein
MRRVSELTLFRFVSAQLNDRDCLCLIGAYSLLGKENALLAIFDQLLNKSTRITISADRMRVLEAMGNPQLMEACTTGLSRVRLVDLPKFRKSATFADGTLVMMVTQLQALPVVCRFDSLPRSEYSSGERALLGTFRSRSCTFVQLRTLHLAHWPTVWSAATGPLLGVLFMIGRSNMRARAVTGTQCDSWFTFSSCLTTTRTLRRHIWSCRVRILPSPGDSFQ